VSIVAKEPGARHTSGVRRLAVLLAIVAAASPLVASAQVRQPTLSLVSRSPLTVRGAEFRARERVHVVFYAGEQTKVVFVRATPTGTFVASADVPFTRCNGVRIVATGLLGSRAAVRLPQPACMPLVHPGASP